MTCRTLKSGKNWCRWMFVVSVLLVISSCKKDNKHEDPPVIPKSDKQLKTFSFSARKNHVLVNDVNGEIVGDTIYARAFAGTDISKLIPSFTYDGAKIVIGEVTQKS